MKFFAFYIFVFLCFCFHARAQSAMDPKVNNFYSFTTEKITNSTELSKYSKDKSHPEFSKLPFNSGCTECFEILERRTADERYFLKEGTEEREFFTQKSFTPMHYKDANGRWITIDPRIKPIGSKIFSAPQQPVPSVINLNEGYTSLQIADKKIQFNQDIKTYFLSKTEESIAQNSSNNVFFTAGDDGVEQRNFFPGIYRQLIAERGSIKANYILQHKPEIPEQAEWMVFEDSWTMPDGFIIKYADDGFATPEGIWIGDLVVIDETGNEFFRIYQPIIYDTNIPDGKNASAIIGYKIENDNGKWVLKVLISTAWLKNENRIYPVTVDPLVSATFAYASAAYGGSGYANGAWTNNGCGYTINATMPAGAQISNCFFSASYSTSTGCSNTCWMSKGAFDLIGPCGRSPQPNNFFWTCAPPAGNAPGTCSGINYAAHELTNCLVPSCTPTPVNITLRLFRNFCVGSGTCDNTCIRLNPNSYSITLQGNTVQGTVTSSSTSVCAGAPAILTAHPLYGVAPYTYTWNPGGLTGSPVTVNPVVNTTYTLIITDACGNTAQSISVVNILPTATANFTVTSPVCVGQSSTITYTGNANGTATFNWNFGGGTIISGSGSGPYQVSWNSSGNFNISLTVTQGGCTSQPFVVPVTVSPPPTITVNPNPASICAGQTVLLTANGAATYTWSPSTNLTATTGASVTASPSANTTYTVTGTANGCTGTATVTVVINALSTVTSTPSSTSICSGGNVTLTGAGAATYVWSPSLSLSSSTGTTVTASPTATTTYYLSGTNAGGCVGFDTSIVTVNPQPTIIINPSAPSLCISNTVQLTASGANSYLWNLSATLSNTVIPNPIASPNATTTYFVTGTSSQGCTNTSQVTVTVNSLPVVSFSGLNTVNCFAPGVNILTGNPAGGVFSGTGINGNSFSATQAGVGGPYTITYSYTDANGCSNLSTQQTTVISGANISVSAVSNSICNGSSTNLLASGGQTYTWSPSAGLSSTNSASTTAQPTVTVTYSVLGIDINGCTGSTTFSITVNPLPIVIATDVSICNGQSGIISASGASSYIWGPNSALSSNIGSNTTASPAVTTTYTVIGTDGNGCSNTATAVVTVNPIPVIGISPNAGLFCEGGSVTLTASGATNYSWSPPAGLNISIGPTVTSTPSSSVVYTVTGTDGNGCAGIAVATLTLDPIPAASFNVFPNVGCEPLLVNFQSTSTNGISSVWYFGDGTSGIGNTTQHIYPVGIYDVLLVSSNISGCADSSLQLSAVTVLPSPIAYFNMDPPAPGNLPFSSNLFSFTNSSIGASSYQWNFGDHTSDTSFNSTHSFTESGEYYVILTATANNGCSDTAQSPLIIIDGEAKPWIPSAFTPNNDAANDLLKIYGIAIAEVDFRVYDRVGEMVFQTNDVTQGWDGNFLGMKSSTDVYVYVAKVKMLSGKKYILKGDVTLIR